MSRYINEKLKINNENIHIANKENNRPAIKDQNRPSSSSRRIPLGGKNPNNNTLNRSNSTLGKKSDNFQPPPLNKSNSSLGFTSIKEAAKIPLQQPQPRSKRPLVSIDDLSYLGAKRQKSLITNDTDSLIKHEQRPKSAIDSISSTYSNYTENLNIKNVPEPSPDYYNVDPIKRNKEIEDLVNKHWQDPIEYIPERSKKEIDDLKYYSTPNNSDEYSLLKNNLIVTTNVSLELSFGDEEDAGDEEVGDIPIQEIDDENIGLSKKI